MPRRSYKDMGITRVTIDDIAVKLGMSKSTISRALRNVRGTKSGTRQLVLETAAQMGYVLGKNSGNENSEASILTLSLGYHGESDQGYLTGISEAAIDHNVAVMSHHYRPQECKKVLYPDSQPRALRTGQLDGIILLHRWPIDVVRDLRRRYPICSVIHTYPGLKIDVIGVEERESMEELMRHMATTGSKRIGFFGYCTEMSWSRSRHAAYVEALGIMGMPYQPDLVIPVSLAQAAAEEVFVFPTEKIEALISQGVTAWVCASETLGHSLTRSLLDKGIKIPQEVSITGFHAQTNSPYGLPKLTSTQLASEEIGRAALRRILTQIENANELHRTILLPSKMVIGETTLPALETKSLTAAGPSDL
jgi:LacI family transcriptional regulator